jgi:hypothetical protein
VQKNRSAPWLGWARDQVAHGVLLTAPVIALRGRNWAAWFWIEARSGHRRAANGSRATQSPASDIEA